MFDSGRSDPLGPDPLTIDTDSSGAADFEEAPWELEIAALLASLPLVEPPAGFLEKAIDRRPLFALRGTVLLVCSVAVGVLGVMQFGVLERDQVVPSVGDLVQRHALASAAVHADAGVQLDDMDNSPLSLPSHLHPEGQLTDQQPYQAVYADEDHTVSVFSQPGRVDWDRLPEEGMKELGGVSAWVDPDQDLVLVESADAAVTIVGLSPNELVGPLQTLSHRSRGVYARVRDTAATLSAELGFADLG